MDVTWNGGWMSRTMMVPGNICHVSSLFLHVFQILAVLVFLLASLVGSVESSKTTFDSFSLPVLILDVDNTLYDESKTGVEAQIVRNTHEFANKYFNLTRDEADDLFREYGSTIEGLRVQCCHNSDSRSPFESVEAMMESFYSEVYSDIDLTCILSQTNKLRSALLDCTGYSHDSLIGDDENSKTIELLSSLASTKTSTGSPHPGIWLASNSSKEHVERVVKLLGLKNRVPIAGILTPDCDAFNSLRSIPQSCFPTKHLSSDFWKPLIQRYYNDQEFFLLEDSRNNLIRARDMGIRGFLVSHVDSQSTFIKGIEAYLKSGIKIVNADGSPYEFSDIKYLQSKNEVDNDSINAELWKKVLEEVHELLLKTNDHILHVVDLGAGLLNMFEKLVGDESIGKENKSFDQIHYTAYESNRNLVAHCVKKLVELGYERDKNSFENIFHGTLPNGITVTFHLKCIDFSNDVIADESGAHLVIGSCFADLYDPDLLVNSLLRFLNFGKDGQSLANKETLVYFPITFSGTTSFFPPSSFGPSCIPSDTIAFQAYSQSLTNMGHNLDPFAIVEAIEAHGGKLLHGIRSSNWNIKFEQNTYLWNTMVYFFSSSGIPHLYSNHWNGVGWIARALEKRPDIHVTNVDFLFRFNFNNESCCAKANIEDTPFYIEEIEFRSPREVGTKIKNWDGHLAPNQIEVETVCSLISSGTELKIFNGSFDRAALDVNIEGFSEAEMSYPLTYGYSSVGRVVRCGLSVPDSDILIGKLVFSFSQHSNRLVLDRDNVHIVPDGIAANDAIFMPSVETALSLVHDASIRIGERVAIYGQGLIGLLVTGILSTNRQCLGQSPGDVNKFGSVTAFDMVADRLAYSSVMGASEGLLPMEASKSGPFDVSIEISGNGRALQAAIDNTSNGGRIIVGSWYGNHDIQLKLGIDFHRSHKTIITSQVSEISANLTDLWTKERRFALTWELVKKLRPSRLITQSVKLSEAQVAYERLDSGNEIAISFDYK